MADWLDLNPDPIHVKREREKARMLRKTDWWRALLAKGECHYCHRKVGAENLTLDHVIPVARGGTSARGNCVPCCRDCNARKKAYTPAEQILDRLFPSAPGGDMPGASVYFKELPRQEDVPEALSEMRRRAKLEGKVAAGDREASKPRTDRSSANH